MPRRTFLSFHHKPDHWRAANIRNMSVVEGNVPVSNSDWETIAGGGDDSIKRWVGEQMRGRSCVILLIGETTAGRKWIGHEIKKGWDDEKGLVGIYVHNLVDGDGNQSNKGRNPFEDFTVTVNDGKRQFGMKLSSIATAYNPPYSASTDICNHIKTNVDAWIEEAMRIRINYSFGRSTSCSLG